MKQVINSIKVIKSHSVGGSIIEVLNRRDPSYLWGSSRPDFPYLIKFRPSIGLLIILLTFSLLYIIIIVIQTSENNLKM